jgi:hypothetical protein
VVIDQSLVEGAPDESERVLRYIVRLNFERAKRLETRVTRFQPRRAAYEGPARKCRGKAVLLTGFRATARVDAALGRVKSWFVPAQDSIPG